MDVFVRNWMVHLDLGITECTSPYRDAEVSWDDQTSALVEFADEVKQSVMRRVWLNGK